MAAREAARPPLAAAAAPRAARGRWAGRRRTTAKLFTKFADGPVAPKPAPVPDDLARRAADIKGAAYFLDAAQAGICRIPANAWLAGGDHPAHEFAVLIMVERPRIPEADNLASEWIKPARNTIADMRAAEIAVCVAGHIRTMGFAARAHFAGIQPASTASGWPCWQDLPCAATMIACSIPISTTSLSPWSRPTMRWRPTSRCTMTRLKAKGLAYWLGINGAQSGRERNRQAKRATHLSRFPMETVKRVARPTTLILDDEVPQVPKRAAFFQRALHNDLGDKAKAERTRFAFKTPLSFSMLQVIRSLVPFQGGRSRAGRRPCPLSQCRDANARAIKSLSYALGSDLTGICEVPRYAWFSHKEDGSEIKPYHRYCRGHADRPGLRHHGGRQRRRLDFRLAIDARLPARRGDRRHHGRAAARARLLGALADQCRLATCCTSR